MNPNLLKNDYVWITKYSYGISKPFSMYWSRPKRGDLVLLQSPDQQWVIRRVIALPEDRLFYHKKKIYLNEKMYSLSVPSELKKLSVHPNYSLWRESFHQQSYWVLLDHSSVDFSFGPYKVPKDHYFVMGDHRGIARDSRNWPPRSMFAVGVLVLRVKNSQSELYVPKGTVFRIENDLHLPVFFETQKGVIVSDQPVSVTVRSQNAGLRGNIPAHSKWWVSYQFSSLDIHNPKPFSGGSDQSFVPLSAIQGKVFKILWSCKKTFEWISFLCHFDSFRKNRWFVSVDSL